MRIDGNDLKGVTGRKYFTWTMENKRPFYDWLRDRAHLVLYEARDTAHVRHLLGLTKTKKERGARVHVPSRGRLGTGVDGGQDGGLARTTFHRMEEAGSATAAPASI